MRKIIAGILLLCLVLSVSACSGETSDAGKVLEGYLAGIRDGDFDSAYGMLTGFDQGNIEKELFVQWQTAAAKLSALESFELDKKVDKFKNYEYMGAKFRKAYGFHILCKRKVLVEGAEMAGYDTEDYRIMVAREDEGWKIALLLTNLEETVKKYQRQLEEKP